MNWYTAPEDDTEELERLLGAWPEAPVENLEVLGMILTTARVQVLACAPASFPIQQAGGYLTAPSAIINAGGGYISYPAVAPPENWVLAQLRQAQALWDAGRVNTNGDSGEGGFVFTPRPMDKTIRAIIRPADGKPHVL